MGSTSTLLALIRVCSLSACERGLRSAFWHRRVVGENRWEWRDKIFFPYGDLETLISEDEGGVGGCQLSGRHCEMCGVVAECRN